MEQEWVVVVVPWAPLAGTPWAGRHAVLAAAMGATHQGAGTVLLDERCPGTPLAHVEACLAAARPDAVVVSVRQVTDTVKSLEGGYVGASVDRDDLVAVCSPVVVPVGLVGALDGLDLADLPGLVAALSARGVPVAHVEAPVEGRRVADADELALLSPSGAA